MTEAPTRLRCKSRHLAELIQLAPHARYGIPELWLVDVNALQLHCMREPQDPGYAMTSVFTRGRIDIAGLPGVAIDLDSVLAD